MFITNGDWIEESKKEISIFINDKIHVYIDHHDVHTFTAWGLSYLSLCILRERLELFTKKKRYDTIKTNKLLKTFMESEGYKNENKSKIQKVSEKPNP